MGRGEETFLRPYGGVHEIAGALRRRLNLMVASLFILFMMTARCCVTGHNPKSHGDTRSSVSCQTFRASGQHIHEPSS